jgi:hypothetical protein
MNMITNQAIFEARAEQELDMAKKATCAEARLVHLDLAALYAAQSEAFEPLKTRPVHAKV